MLHVKYYSRIQLLLGNLMQSECLERRGLVFQKEFAKRKKKAFIFLFIYKFKIKTLSLLY